MSPIMSLRRWISSIITILFLPSLFAQAPTNYQNENRRLGNSQGFLTGPNSGSAENIARQFFLENLGALSLQSLDAQEFSISHSHGDSASGTNYFYFVQKYQELEIFGAQTSIHVARGGEVINAYTNFFSSLDEVVSGSEVLTEIEAAERVAEYLGYTFKQELVVLEPGLGPDRATVLSSGGLSDREIFLRLVFQPVSAKRVRLAWNVHFDPIGSPDFWNISVDAETGEILYQSNFTVSEHFSTEIAPMPPYVPEPSPAPKIVGKVATMKVGPPTSQYEVFEIPKEYPDDGPRTVVADPHDTTFSPEGWHDTDGNPGPEHTITRGNNVDAYADRNDNNSADPGSQPDGGVNLDFTGALVPYSAADEPDQYIPAAVTNLFYWNNIIHDVTARHGFTEEAGNFQEFNYSGNGVGGDSVNAEAQDGADIGNSNNANFATPSDGSNPRMQMYIWNNTTPNRDGDFSSMIIAHEYGHGVSNRLTGGGANVNCLNNNEQMGEGWSDLLGLILTANAGDTATTLRGVGTWALGQPNTGPGIRAAPYTTDTNINGWTYDDIKTTSGPHPLGHIWASMAWDVYWALVTEHGFNPDIYGDWNTGGNNLALRLVLDGMKLQPCSPGFVDGRDGIIAADLALTGGANECIIWEAFAARGLGFSADQGSTGSRTDGTEAFDIPPQCQLLFVPAADQTICAGSDAVFTVALGQGFATPVTLSASGNPAGTTVSFDTNPVGSVPADITMTVSGTGSLADGMYTIQVMAADGSQSPTFDVNIEVFQNQPGNPNLTGPADTSTGTSLRPLLTWEEGTSNSCDMPAFWAKVPYWSVDEDITTLVVCLDEANAFGGSTSPATSFTLQIDDDPAFGSLHTDTTVTSMSGYPVGALDTLTQYYWRVRAHNPCGDSGFSQVWSFTTGDVPAVLLVDDDDNSPDMRATWEAILNDAGLAGFDVWDTANSDNEPTAGELAAYGLVVWFTGDEFGGAAGPGSAGETALATYLDNGGCLFLSSQDYHYDRTLTSFMQNYLGVSAVSNDTDQTNIDGSASSIFDGMGPYNLVYSGFSNFSDTMTAGNGGVAAFDGDQGVAATHKLTGTYSAAYLAFPLEAVENHADRVAILLAFLASCP